METSLSPRIPETLLSQLGEQAVLQAMLETVGAQMLILDTEQRLVYCGEAFARLLGYMPDAMMGKSLCHFQPTEPPTTAARSVTAPRCPSRYQRQDGAIIEIHLACSPLHDATGHAQATLCMLQTPQDTHAQATAEANHRVRNNLAIICALLDMEMMHAPEPERQRLLISLARTRSLGLSYNLGQPGSELVEVGQLVQAVIDSLRALYVRADGTMALSCSAPVYLSMKRATYLSLALTELAMRIIPCVTAHGAQTLPTMTITEDDGLLRIVVAADGCPRSLCSGLSPLSRELLDGLMEHSLGGTIVYDTDAPFRAVLCCAAG
jgi:PAS domain S-box-containing protein